MSQNLTFANAYYQQVKIPDFSSKTISHISQKISEEEIRDALSKVAAALSEEKNSTVLKQMKSRLKQIPVTFTVLVGAWLDNDGLDILHYSIINNCPEMVEFLLMEPKWFPQTHMPKQNPYGHLAATFGYTECLRLLLQYRPNDYFIGSKGEHVLKLPASVKKKLKPPDSIRSNVNRYIDKLLWKIKSSTETAEIAMQQKRNTLSDIKDVSNILTDEIDALEKSNKKQGAGKKKLKNLGLVNKGPKRRTSNPVVVSPPPHRSQTTVVKFGTAEGLDRRFSVGIKMDRPHEIKPTIWHKPQHVKGDKAHTITVNWDVFSEAVGGVVKGAGETVRVKYSENARAERFHLGIIEQEKIAPAINTNMPLLSQVKPSDVPRSNKSKPAGQRLRRYTASTTTLPKVLEPGIRGKNKYKDFHLNLEPQMMEVKDESSSLKNKTPLSIAAQYGHIECVQMILETFIMKNNPNMAVKEPLTLATKAKSPDAIMLLMDHKVSKTDFQSAVLIALRDMYPDCLTALLTQKSKERQSLFDGMNLYHILYTQSLLSVYRYEMLPIMTKVLINSNEDVNAHNVHCTFPMYSLINCAFNITIGKKIFYYVECLKILLENKANPHFDEGKSVKVTSSSQLFSRSAYSSAIDCILDSAMSSINYFESSYWSKIFMKKIITTLTTCDLTNRRLLNDVLFKYMNTVCSLGLDRYIVRCLLRYGANVDFRSEGKYAINVYFDQMLPYLSKFEVYTTHSKWQQEINGLMMVCRGMTYRCLKEAELLFLNEHLLQCPIQALPLCRYFSYLINEMLLSPRPLADLTAQFIWLRLRRNEKRAKALPVPDDIIALVLP